MSIMAFVMASMFSQMSKQQKSVSEMLSLSETKVFLLSSFSNTSTCAAQLSAAATQDIHDANTYTASTSEFDYSVLKAGALATSPVIAKVGQSLNGIPSQMIVSSIKLGNIMQTGGPDPNEYKGVLKITLDPNTTVRSYRPVTYSTTFTIASPSTSATIVGCGASGPVIPPGTICGWAISGCGYSGSAKCLGVDPACGACPAGYTWNHWNIAHFGPSNQLWYCFKN